MHVLSNLDRHQHALNEHMGRELFMFVPVFKALSQIFFYNYIVYNKEYVYARILFTNDQTKWTSTSFECFSRSTAVIVDFTLEVNCNQLCNNYRPISTVHYRRILYGHMVGMVRCDWPFTVGYIIINIPRINDNKEETFECIKDEHNIANTMCTYITNVG